MSNSNKFNASILIAGILGCALLGSAKIMVAVFCCAVVIFLAIIANSLEKIANK